MVLGSSLNSPPRVTRRPAFQRRQVRRRLQRLRARQLLVALFAASTLQWTTRKPRNQHSQSTKRMQLFHPVQNLPTAAAPCAGCKRTRMRSDFPHTRRLPMPRERISTIRNRNRRPKVRCGGHRPGSSARVNSCITKRFRGQLPITYVDTRLYEGGHDDYYEAHSRSDLRWIRRIHHLLDAHKIQRWPVP